MGPQVPTLLTGVTMEQIKKMDRSIHCKKGLAVFPSPAGMSLTKLLLGGNNLIFPAQR